REEYALFEPCREPAAVEPGRHRGAEDGLGAARAKPFGPSLRRVRPLPRPAVPAAPLRCAAACKAAPREGPANQGGTTEAVGSRPCRVTRPGRDGGFSLLFRRPNQREEIVYHV